MVDGFLVKLAHVPRLHPKIYANTQNLTNKKNYSGYTIFYMAKEAATQEFVPIKEIRDGVVILKDGGLRAILLTSSLNIALKSNDEQTAILLQFQNFLNSLDFSLQIVIQSRRLDIRPYLNLLEERAKSQMEDLMKIQIREYIDFIRTFTETTNIMTKHFFLIIPYAPPILKAGKLPFSNNKKTSADTRTLENFEEAKTQLEQRVGIVSQGLSRLGLRTVRLGTEEMVEVFYRIFNPGEGERSIASPK